MQQMGMCSTTSFSNSTFLFTSLHHGAAGSCQLSNSKNIRTLFPSFPLSRPTHFTSLSLFPNFDSNKLGVSAFKKRSKGGGTLLKMDGSDHDDDDEFFDFDDEFEGGVGDDEEEVFFPAEKMKKWLERKPRGFGEGKVYDTSIEDKLFEEIEQSRRAQIVNVNKLKNSPVSSASKDDQQEKKAEDVPTGIRVRVVNLPKKKNIHRDLKAAFEGVSGIINISPAVSGNKKTRDPVCKGFAFVEFKHEADATRFVQNFSGNSIMFGKIQKQIKCEMVNSLSPGREESRDNNSRPPKVAVSGLIDSPNVDLDIEKSLSDLSLEDASDEFDDQDDEFDMDGLGEDRNDLNAIGDDLDDEFDTIELGEDRNNLYAIGDDQDYEFDTVELGEGRNNLNGIGDDQDDEFDTVEQGDDRNNFNAIGDDQDDEFDMVEQGEDRNNLNAIGDDQDEGFDTVELVEDRNNPNAFGESKSSSGNDLEQTLKRSADSITSSRLERIRALEQRLLARGKQQRIPKEQKGQKLERIRGVEKKPPGKGKQQKIPKEQKVQKLNVPGSAKRLKIKEKAVLTDVFSKYGLKTAKES